MSIRLNSVMSILNIGLDTISDFLGGMPELGPIDNLTNNSKITDAQFEALKEKYQKDSRLKERAGILSSKLKEITENKKKKNRKDNVLNLKVLGRIDLNNIKHETTPKVENEIVTKQNVENTPKNENLIKIKLGDLDFIKRQIVYRLNDKKYVLNDKHISAKFEKYRADFENIETYIQLYSRKNRFEFVNSFILNNLINIIKTKKKEFKKEFKEKKEIKLQKIKEKEKEKELKKLIKKYSNDSSRNDQKDKIAEKRSKIILSIPLSKIRFSGITATINYKNKLFTKYIKKEDKELLKSLDKNQVIPVALNPSNLTFVFSVRIVEFVKKIKELKSHPSSQPLTQQKAKLGIENIDFLDNYYLIWIISNGKKITSITPLRVTDYNSLHCLSLIQKYFSDRFPQNIEIIYDSEKVIGLTQVYKLSNYIKVLKDKVDEPGEWWEEVQNERKPSLSACMETLTVQIRKEISLRNCYLDYLAGMPNQRTVIKVYEVRQNQPEDVFIFTVDIKNGCYAVIFENVSFTATATWVFIVKEDCYLECIQRIFDYFTNYELHNKRQSLIRSLNPPQKFKAEEYFKIMHNEPKSWIKRLNDILVRKIPLNKIQFNQGLHISEETDSRSSSTEEVKVKHLHNELMKKLYHQLCLKYGEENVGTENHIGNKKIDVVAKTGSGYNIYEIKTDKEPRGCVRDAMGQILDYAYFECTDVIHSMIIVGESPITNEVNTYLKKFREKNSLEIYYMKV